jgi:hypothetical protein
MKMREIDRTMQSVVQQWTGNGKSQLVEPELAAHQRLRKELLACGEHVFDHCLHVLADSSWQLVENAEVKNPGSGMSILHELAKEDELLWEELYTPICSE